MPVYTYRCESCGVQFERFQKFEDQPLTWCPECKKKALRKVYTPVGIVFKGSGFYATDHRSPSGQTFSSSEKSSESKSETKSESKTETKSDSKPAENSSSTPKSESKSE
jgi:putative FmdB family regulatory protein